MSVNNCISFIGIIFDIIGAWYLAKGSTTKSVEEIRTEKSLYNLFTKSLSADIEIKQKSESLVGFLILVLGFLLQGVSYIIVNIMNWNTFYGVLIISVIILMVILKYGKFVDRILLKRSVKYYIEKESRGKSDYRFSINEINRYLIIFKNGYKDQKEVLIKLFEDTQKLSGEEKTHAEIEYKKVTEQLWEDLNIELKETFVEKKLFPKKLFY